MTLVSVVGLLDTNMVLRVLTDDPPGQARTAKALLAQCRATGERLFLPATHFLEVGYVLESVYRCTRSVVAESLTATLEDVVIACEQEFALRETVHLYSEGADLPDAYLAARAKHEQQPIFSFDRDFDGLGVKRLVKLA